MSEIPPPPPEEEQYLGGLTSASLRLMGRGIGGIGIGVYATTRRLIGVNSNKGLLLLVDAIGFCVFIVISGIGFLGFLDDIIFLGLLFIVFFLAARNDLSTKTIAQLEEKKVFEVRKEEISEIEVKKPGTGYTPYLNITLNSGENIKVTIGPFVKYENIRDLMKSFYPQRLKVEEINIKEAQSMNFVKQLRSEVNLIFKRAIKRENGEVTLPLPPPPPSERYKSQFHCKACGCSFWVYEHRLKIPYCHECGAPDPVHVVTVEQ